MSHAVTRSVLALGDTGSSVRWRLQCLQYGLKMFQERGREPPRDGGNEKKKKGKEGRKRRKEGKRRKLMYGEGRKRGKGEGEHTQMCQTVTKLINLYFMIPLIQNIQNWQT